MTQIILNIVLIAVFLGLAALLVKKLRNLKSKDEDIEKLIEELSGDDEPSTSKFDRYSSPSEPSGFSSEDEVDSEEPSDDITDVSSEEDLLETPSEEIREVTSRMKIKDFEIGPDEVKLHEKAKRKARVIVREIEMYNREKTEMGLKAGNLYKFLKEEIDNGRKTYEQAVQDDISQNTNYFDESLVNILAKGDKNLLGLP